MYLAVLSLVAQSCPTLCDPMDCSPPGSSVHGDSLSKDTGVGCHALFQGNFLTQGSNPGLLHCREILYCLSHQGSPDHQGGFSICFLMERDTIFVFCDTNLYFPQYFIMKNFNREKLKELCVHYLDFTFVNILLYSLYH